MDSPQAAPTRKPMVRESDPSPDAYVTINCLNTMKKMDLVALFAVAAVISSSSTSQCMDGKSNVAPVFTHIGIMTRVVSAAKRRTVNVLVSHRNGSVTVGTSGNATRQRSPSHEGEEID